MTVRTDILNRECEIRTWVSEGLSKKEIAKRLGCDHDTLNRYLNHFGIEYKGLQNWAKGRTYKSSHYIPYAEYIQGKSVQTNKLRIKLLTEGVKQAVCESCGNDSWQGVPIPLEVHHIDGDKTHNTLDNLQILCPNCHALTSTYRGKNIKK